MMSEVPTIGHNNPPSLLEFSGETATFINNWLTTNPVIQNEETARDAKLVLDRGRSCLQELEEERKAAIKPFRTKITEITDVYSQKSDPITSLLSELRSRLKTFIDNEEAKRLKEAEIARQRAIEAEQRAREAEEREQIIKDEAEAGAEGDLLSATKDADAAFSDFEKAKRDEIRAERQATVRIGGGYRKSVSLRTSETLILTDPALAIADMGFSAKLIESIISDARKFRQTHGRLPNGVTSKKDRVL